MTVKEKPVYYASLYGGLFGSGKTTLARSIIKTDGGWVNHGTYTTTNAGKYTFTGRYADGSKHGGVDSLNSSKQLLAVAKMCDTPVFIMEGVCRNQRVYLFLIPFFSFSKQLIIYLAASPALCYERRPCDRDTARVPRNPTLGRDRECVRQAGDRRSRLQNRCRTITRFHFTGNTRNNRPLSSFEVLA